MSHHNQPFHQMDVNSLCFETSLCHVSEGACTDSEIFLSLICAFTWSAKSCTAHSLINRVARATGTSLTQTSSLLRTTSTRCITRSPAVPRGPLLNWNLLGQPQLSHTYLSCWKRMHINFNDSSSRAQQPWESVETKHVVGQQTQQLVHCHPGLRQSGWCSGLFFCQTPSVFDDKWILGKRKLTNLKINGKFAISFALN